MCLGVESLGQVACQFLKLLRYQMPSKKDEPVYICTSKFAFLHSTLINLVFVVTQQANNVASWCDLFVKQS